LRLSGHFLDVAVTVFARLTHYADCRHTPAALGLNSVHLEADVDELYMLDETRHVLVLTGQPDNPLEGIVACGLPESESFKTYLDKIAGHPQTKRNSSCTPHATG